MVSLLAKSACSREEMESVFKANVLLHGNTIKNLGLVPATFFKSVVPWVVMSFAGNLRKWILQYHAHQLGTQGP